MTDGFILKNWLTQWGVDFKPEIHKADSLQDGNSNTMGSLLQSDQQGINLQNIQTAHGAQDQRKLLNQKLGRSK